MVILYIKPPKMCEYKISVVSVIDIRNKIRGPHRPNLSNGVDIIGRRGRKSSVCHKPHLFRLFIKITRVFISNLQPGTCTTVSNTSFVNVKERKRYMPIVHVPAEYAAFLQGQKPPNVSLRVTRVSCLL